MYQARWVEQFNMGRPGLDIWLYEETPRGMAIVRGPSEPLTIENVRDDVVVDGPPLLRLSGPQARAVLDAAVDFTRLRGPDPGTEAKILRESLEVERARVDRILP